jgi:hypothetical protein
VDQTAERARNEHFFVLLYTKLFASREEVPERFVFCFGNSSFLNLFRISLRLSQIACEMASIFLPSIFLPKTSLPFGPQRTSISSGSFAAIPAAVATWCISVNERLSAVQRLLPFQVASFSPHPFSFKNGFIPCHSFAPSFCQKLLSASVLALRA